MSKPKPVKPVLFFIAQTSSSKIKEDFLPQELLPRLEPSLGMIALQSEPYEFSQFTSYYEKEMGFPLFKSFLFFEILREPEFLVELKHLCFYLEREFSEEEKRLVNLDPGYLTLSKVVLSTFKDYAHRIYLGRGVYAEVEYVYWEGSFQVLPWTYPDYQEEKVIAMFNRAREFYKERLRCL